MKSDSGENKGRDLNPNQPRANQTSQASNSRPAGSQNYNQNQNLKRLAGVVERITFQSQETGYTVARLLPDAPGAHNSSAINNPSSSSSAQSGPTPSTSSYTQRSFFRQARGEDNLV